MMNSVECSDSEKNMSAYADQNHAPSLTCVRLELGKTDKYKNAGRCKNIVPHFFYGRVAYLVKYAFNSSNVFLTPSTWERS